MLINLQTRWSVEEKDLFAKLWNAGRSLRSIRRSLPGKSDKSLATMRVRMKLPIRFRRWTAAEIKTLRSQWGIESLYWIARHLRRKPSAVAMKARALRLEMEAPSGWETLEAAARRTNYCPETLLRILPWAGVTMRAPYSPSYRQPLKVRRAKRVIVEAFEVDEAIERWHKTERLTEAARRAGMNDDALLRLLRRHEVEIIQLQARGQLRVWSADVDRVLATEAKGETLKQAAKRLDMGLDAMRKYVRIVGFERANQFVLIPRDVSDKAAAMFRAGTWAQQRAPKQDQEAAA